MIRAILAALMLSGPVLAGPAGNPVEVGLYEVIDGDTIRAGGKTYRLLGYDTPETYFARCEAELHLGLIAKWRLAAMVALGTAELIDTGRSGKYGRTLAYLKINGKDVGEILIREGLARPYHGERRKGWCNGG